MILELVEFNSPKGWSRQQVAEEARNVIPKWRANKELLRKHFLLELDGKTGAGVYIWPSVDAAKRAHNEEWRQSVITRTEQNIREDRHRLPSLDHADNALQSLEQMFARRGDFHVRIVLMVS